MKTNTLYRKNDKGRYIPVAEEELYNNKRYDHGLYLIFSRPGVLSTLRLDHTEEDITNILHLCVQKLSVEEISEIVSKAHDKVQKKEKDGHMYYIPAVWYEEIAKLLLERSKTK